MLSKEESAAANAWTIYAKVFHVKRQYGYEFLPNT
jgi:hypothetical protein